MAPGHRLRHPPRQPVRPALLRRHRRAEMHDGLDRLARWLADEHPSCAGSRLHPVKSTAIRHVERADVRPWGLAGDRRWMVVDATGSLVTRPRAARAVHDHRRHPRDLPASRRRAPPLRRGSPTARRGRAGHRPACRSGCTATTCSARRRRRGRASRGSARSSAATTYAWCGATTRRRRPLNPAYSRAGRPHGVRRRLSGDPGLAGLAGPAQRLDRRGRRCPRGEEPGPALPIDALPAQPRRRRAPNRSPRTAGSGSGSATVTFRKAKVVDRCVMTTISPVDLATGKEPIRTLARHRGWDRKTWFAIQLVPETHRAGRGRRPGGRGLKDSGSRRRR